MSKLYLAYGSNLNLQQMAYRCPTARVVATTYLEHYKLTFRGHNGNAVATVEPSENDRVPVMIWKIFAESIVDLNCMHTLMMRVR